MIILEFYFGEMFLAVSNRYKHFIFTSSYHIECAIISLVFENTMARCGPDLTVAQVAALSPAHFRNSTDKLMNVRIILLVVKTVISGHVPYFDRFRR